MVATPKFKRETITIPFYSYDKHSWMPTEFTAYTLGPISIIRRDHDAWSVTHKATGKVAQRGNWFSRLTDAKAYVIGMLAIPGAEAHFARITTDNPNPDDGEGGRIIEALRQFSKDHRPR